jgi:GMP reductase
MRFDFQDINLEPKKGIVQSRSECDTSFQLGKSKFKLPIVPANMESIINESLAINLAKSGYFYIMHRFEFDSFRFTKKMKELNLPSSISIGVNEESYELLNQMISENCIPDFITIDIAHGHCIKMEKMLKFIKSKKIDSFIIAGNISSTDAVYDLEDWGADAIKVGVAPGSPCLTGPATGFGSRGCQASTIWECSKVARVPLIADGGLKVPGDITKSLVLGATLVMVGGMLSGLQDSPGHIVEIDGKEYKEYWGSASEFQSGKKNRIEGKRILTPLKNNGLLEELKYLEECLQSSISYAGGRDLSAFESVKWF